MHNSIDYKKFLGSAALLAKPIRQLSEVNSNVQKGIAAAGTIFSTLDEPDEPDLGTVEKARVDGHFQFKNVSFAYSEEAGNVLNGIDLVVRPGEVIALVGQSGSGKTTLVKLNNMLNSWIMLIHVRPRCMTSNRSKI